MFLHQSELLKKDFNELFETLKKLKVQTSLDHTSKRNKQVFMVNSLHGCKENCNVKGVNFIDNFNLFWS